MRVRRKQRVLLGDGWVVEHGHSFHAQQHGQTPRNHVVEDNGAGGGGGGGRETSHETERATHADGVQARTQHS